MRLINDRLANNTVSPADVDLVCELGEDGGLNQEIDRLQPSPAQANAVAHAAVLACLGNPEARAQVLLALTSPDEQEAQIAQVYLRRRPITNVHEIRDVTSSVAHMNDPTAQVRALDTLAGQHLSDPESLEELAQLFLVARSLDVQAAIAGILIRSDYQAIATLNLAQELRESSLAAAGHSGPVDIFFAVCGRIAFPSVLPAPLASHRPLSRPGRRRRRPNRAPDRTWRRGIPLPGAQTAIVAY